MSKMIQHSDPRMDVWSGNSSFHLSRATDGIDSLEIHVKLSVKNIGVCQKVPQIIHSMMWTNPAYLHLKAERVVGGGGCGSGGSAIF